MLNGIGNIAYLGAATLFILSLRGLSHPSTARRGNLYGVAGMLIGFTNYLMPAGDLAGAERVIHLSEIYLGVFIGTITFTGSIVAFLKLQGTISGKPLVNPARHMLTLSRLF